MKTFEVNFDGIVGPTHNYAGLAFGNVASAYNAYSVSHPRQAALQGLRKMKCLMDMGIKQAVLPPHNRPDIQMLRHLGFQGSDAKILETAYHQNPLVFAACCSASGMWTANAATISPSADTEDQKVHFTPANLSSNLHRSLESTTTEKILKSIFSDEHYFVVHPPLLATLGDEGAANHIRLCQNHGQPGIELFTYGRSIFDSSESIPGQYPARQTLEASQAIARHHGLSERQFVFVRQNPDVIDQGVFHNDVIAVGNENVLLYHEAAFLDEEPIMKIINHYFQDAPFHISKIKNKQLSVKEVVETYLFNSQLVTLPNQTMTIIAPVECQHHERARLVLDELVSRDNPIERIEYIDVRESMKNGGGPACLRLRVVLNEKEMQVANPQVSLDNNRLAQLEQWVKKHYREQLTLKDLVDPQLLRESQAALDELTQLLGLGSIYMFQ